MGVLAGLVFLTGVIAALFGFSLFGFVTFRAGVLSRSGAVLLAAAPVLWLLAFVVALGDWALGGWVLVLAIAAFVLGWVFIGIQAIRLDQPATDARPA